jgi:hypothetical protein
LAKEAWTTLNSLLSIEEFLMLYHPTELVKSQDVIVRVGSIAGTARPVITQSGATFTVSGAPTLYTLQAATTASVAFNDGNQEFYLLGGGGFADSVIVTSQATASITSYFQKDVDGTVFLPNSFDEAFQAVSASRYDKNHEVYVEINKQLGASGNTYYYDRVAFVACVMNYNESYPADNLVEVTFDLTSRGRIGIHQNAENTGSLIPSAPNS